MVFVMYFAVEFAFFSCNTAKILLVYYKKIIKDYNSGYIDRNKCKYELAREVAKHQKHWNAGKVDGTQKAAVACFIVFPDDLFDH